MSEIIYNTIASLYERLRIIESNENEDFDQALIESKFSPENMGKYLNKIFRFQIDKLQNCTESNEIPEEQFSIECPYGGEIINSMHSILDNGSDDCIMKHIHFYKLNHEDYAIIHKADNNPNTKAIFSNGYVYAHSGAIKNGNNGLNEVLNRPKAAINTIYFVDGRSIYYHDSLGRLTTEATIYTKDFIPKSKPGKNTQEICKLKEGYKDEGSHSVPVCVGGPNESINIIPLSKVINRGKKSEWRSKENLIKSALDLGFTLYVEHTYGYDDNSRRPKNVSFNIRMTIPPNWHSHIDNK